MFTESPVGVMYYWVLGYGNPKETVLILKKLGGAGGYKHSVKP